SVCLCRSTAGTPDRLGAKGFQPASPRSPPGRGLLQLGQDQSAVVGAPPRCERVSAGKPTFAPGAGATTVGGQDQSAFVGAPHRCERVSAGKPTFAPEAGAPTVGAGSVCLCRSTAPVRKGFSRQAHIRPRGGGSYSRGAGSVCLCRSTAGTPDRLGAKGFQPTSPHSPPGRGLPQSGGRLEEHRRAASVR